MVDTTKSDRVRRVDIDRAVRDELARAHREFLEANMRAGRALGPWVFRRPSGERLTHSGVGEQMKKILGHGNLPTHFSPHSLRHTFASVHIKLGTDITYLKEQLGHSSILMTYDIYGHWLNKSSASAARRFQEALGSRK